MNLLWCQSRDVGIPARRGAGVRTRQADHMPAKAPFHGCSESQTCPMAHTKRPPTRQSHAAWWRGTNMAKRQHANGGITPVQAATAKFGSATSQSRRASEKRQSCRRDECRARVGDRICPSGNGSRRRQPQRSRRRAPATTIIPLKGYINIANSSTSTLHESTFVLRKTDAMRVLAVRQPPPNRSIFAQLTQNACIKQLTAMGIWLSSNNRSCPLRLLPKTSVRERRGCVAWNCSPTSQGWLREVRSSKRRFAQPRSTECAPIVF